MAQMAQQELIVIKCGYLGDPDTITEDVKTKLRKCFLRGTLMDVQLDCDGDEPIAKEVVKVLSYQIIYEDSDNKIPQGLSVSIYSTIDVLVKTIDCGEFQSSDYEDNAPLDE